MTTEVLKNQPGALTVIFSGAADGAVTVTITDAVGNVVVNAAAATHGTGGTYTYTLAPQSAVASLTAVWSGTFSSVPETITQQIEVVGAELFSLSDIRAFDSALAGKSDADLIAARVRARELFEARCGVSFVPRWGTTTTDGRGQTGVWVDHRRVRSVISGTVDGTALTSDQLAQLTIYEDGKIDRFGYWSWWLGDRPHNVTLVYEHGYAQPPSEISRVGMILARYELTASNLADRWISQSNEFGIIRQAVPSMQNPTGIPIVDATLARYDETPILAVY